MSKLDIRGLSAKSLFSARAGREMRQLQKSLYQKRRGARSMLTKSIARKVIFVERCLG